MKIPRVLPHKLTPAAAPTSTGSLEHGVITSPSASSCGESFGSHWEISVISVLNWVNCPTRFSQECRSERRRSCSYQVLKMNPVWLFCVTDLSDVPRSESRRSQDGKATFRWCREKRDTVIANDPNRKEQSECFLRNSTAGWSLQLKRSSLLSSSFFFSQTDWYEIYPHLHDWFDAKTKQCQHWH